MYHFLFSTGQATNHGEIGSLLGPNQMVWTALSVTRYPLTIVYDAFAAHVPPPVSSIVVYLFKVAKASEQRSMDIQSSFDHGQST